MHIHIHIHGTIALFMVLLHNIYIYMVLCKAHLLFGLGRVRDTHAMPCASHSDSARHPSDATSVARDVDCTQPTADLSKMFPTYRKTFY